MARTPKKTKGNGGENTPPEKEKLTDRLSRYAMYGQMYNDRGSNMTYGQRMGGAMFNALEQQTLGQMGMLGGAISAGIHSRKGPQDTKGGSGVDTPTIPFQPIKGDDVVSAVNQSTRQVVGGLNSVNTTMGRGFNSLRDGVQAQSQALNSIVGSNEDVSIQLREIYDLLDRMSFNRGGGNGVPAGLAPSGFMGSQPPDASRQNNSGFLGDAIQGAIISAMTGALTKLGPLLAASIIPLMGGAITHFLDQDASKAGNSIVGSWINENIPGAAAVDDFVFRMSGGYVGTDINDPRYSWNKNKDASPTNKPPAVNPNKSRADAILNPSIAPKASPGLTAQNSELTREEIDQLFKIAPVGMSNTDLMALAEKTFPGRKYNTLKARIKQLQQLMQPGPQSGLQNSRGVQVASLDPSIGISSGDYLTSRLATSESKLKAQEATAEKTASENITQSITMNARDLVYKADKITFDTDTLEFIFNDKKETMAGASSATPGGSNFSGGNDGGYTGGPISGTTGQVLETIKKRESGGNYQAHSKSSSASGAYQFIDSTWQSLTKKYGVGGQYKSAGEAPPAVQDAVAKAYVDDILKENNGDVSKVPLVWYTGNAQGKMSQEALAVNNGLTPESYQAKWMNDFSRIAGTNANAATPSSGSNATPSPSSTSGSGLQGPDATPSPSSNSGSGLQGPDVQSGSQTEQQSTTGGGGSVIEQQSKVAGIRKQPLSSKLKGVLQRAATAAGVDAVVFSGGQPAKGSGGRRTGSTRHDNGNAADLYLMRGGRKLSDTNSEDKAIMAKFVSAAVSAGATGVGAGHGYMGPSNIHVGFGKQATWGGASWIKSAASGVYNNQDLSSQGGGQFGGGGGHGSHSEGPTDASPVSSGFGGGGGIGGMGGANPISGMMGALGSGGNPLTSMMGTLGGGGSPFGMIGNLMGAVLGGLSSSTSIRSQTSRSGPVTANIINNTKKDTDSTGTNFPDPKTPLPAIDTMFARLFDGSSMFG